jgi:glycine/D-amino acid oxidase-like deaminating enzyme
MAQTPLKTYDVIVVGAGIFGSSTAYHLKRAGAGSVLLVDKAASAGAGTTAASAAIVRQHYSNKVLADATGRSIKILRELEEKGAPRQLFSPAGWYFLVPDSALQSARDNVRMHQDLGIATELVDIETAAPRLSWLNPDGVAAVVFEPKSGYADPVACAEAFVKNFQSMGGETSFHTECKRLVRRNNRILGIETTQGQCSAAVVINACGPWARKLAATANIDLEMEIYREQETIWECPRNGEMPRSSISDAVDAIYLRPLGDGRYTAGRGFPKPYVEANPDTYIKRVDEEFIDDVLTRLKLRFVPFSNCRYVDGFASLYDVTKDWYPYVGPRSDVEGYADASGGSGHGFKLAPALGRDLADWIVRGNANEDVRALSYNRISEDRLFVQKYGGNRG